MEVGDLLKLLEKYEADLIALICRIMDTNDELERRKLLDCFTIDRFRQAEMTLKSGHFVLNETLKGYKQIKEKIWK